MNRLLVMFLCLFVFSSSVWAQQDKTENKDKEETKSAEKSTDEKTSKKAASKKKAPKEEKPKATSVHHLALSGTYVDFVGGATLDIQSLVLGGGAKRKSFYKLCDHLEKIGDDEDLEHIVFDLSAGVSFNPAQLDELSRRLGKLNDKGKKTYAWLENAEAVHLAIAATCDEVIMADFGGVDMPSASMSSMFFRDAMDLVGVKASVVRAGDFKGAVEPYMNPKMSKHLRQHYLDMLTSINDAAVSRIAKGRGLKHQDVRKLQAKRMLLPKEALRAGLVDTLAPYGSMKDTIDKMVGGETKWRTPKSTKKAVTIFDLFSPRNARDYVKDNSVAVLHLSGAITDGKTGSSGIVSGPSVKAIEELISNKRVKAVVVRVNSPGGSATASEAVRQALVKLTKEKPVVVSMGEMAASGGYWISCIDAPVYAERGTITGSIGVFTLKMGFGQLMRRVGIHEESITLDDSASLFAMARDWDEKDVASMQSSIDSIYTRFLKLVGNARGMDIEKVKPIAGGRVWSGTQAKKLGLVDEIGGLDDCLKLAVKRAKLDEFNVIHRPKVSSGIDLGELMGGGDDEIFNNMFSSAALNLLSRTVGGDTSKKVLRDAWDNAGSRPTVWLLNDAAIRVK
ncbi:MAG: signal peptide peptidase SppA [Mariniblastus sp.]